jgi:hypothetical protein
LLFRHVSHLKVVAESDRRQRGSIAFTIPDGRGKVDVVKELPSGGHVVDASDGVAILRRPHHAHVIESLTYG